MPKRSAVLILGGMSAGYSPERVRLAEDANAIADRLALVELVRRHTEVDNPRVLGAIGRVPRHRFVPPRDRAEAYQDKALGIGHEQTISQPSMLAIMLDELDVQPGHRVLEVGAGSGYAAALLAELDADVHSVEFVPALAAAARARLSELGYDRVHVVEGNGRLGLPDHAPFDRILVSAAAESVPPALLAQLAPQGRVAMPVGSDMTQLLLIGDRDERGAMHWTRSIPCRFVPLVES